MQLICKSVSLGYESHIVSEGIDFTVAQGDYLCIVGENVVRNHQNGNAFLFVQAADDRVHLRRGAGVKS